MRRPSGPARARASSFAPPARSQRPDVQVALLLPIPETPEDVTPDWLTAALTETGVLQQGRVAATRWERVGQEYGFTGARRPRPASVRALDRRPARVVDREAANGSGTRCLGLPRAPGARPRPPAPPLRALRSRGALLPRDRRSHSPRRPYYAAADDEDRRVVLLLEDVGAGRQGDVLHGCSVDDCSPRDRRAGAVPCARGGGSGVQLRGFQRIGSDPRARQKRYDGQVDRFLDECGEVSACRLQRRQCAPFTTRCRCR